MTTPFGMLPMPLRAAGQIHFAERDPFFVLPVQLPEHYAIEKEKRAAERYYANQRTRQPSSTTG
jgi:hypothetical protein